MAVGVAHVFPGFLTPEQTQLFSPKPPTTFLTCFCRSERQKYTTKKVHHNRGSNTQPPGHESEMLTTESTGPGNHLAKQDPTVTKMENDKSISVINSLSDHV